MTEAILFCIHKEQVKAGCALTLWWSPDAFRRLCCLHTRTHSHTLAHTRSVESNRHLQQLRIICWAAEVRSDEAPVISSAVAQRCVFFMQRSPTPPHTHTHTHTIFPAWLTGKLPQQCFLLTNLQPRPLTSASLPPKDRLYGEHEGEHGRDCIYRKGERGSAKGAQEESYRSIERHFFSFRGRGEVSLKGCCSLLIGPQGWIL